MNQRRTPFLVGLMAAVILFFRGPSPPAPEPQAAGASALRPSGDVGGAGAIDAQPPEPAGSAPARVQMSRWQYARLYRDLLGIENPPPQPRIGRVRGSLATQPLNVEILAAPDAIPVSDDELREIAAAARRVGDRLNFMIALVPDPIDSGLPSDFDLTMSALQSGLAEAGYRVDRQWLPWVEPEAAEARTYRETAGLMLFSRGRRPSGDQPWFHETEAGRQLLGVFVVGETLKAGIHKAAFQGAVDFILDLHEQDQSLDGAAALPAYDDAPCPEIPVLGPSSSGSVHSLRLALDRDRKGPAPCYHIVSGTASAPGLEGLMDAELPSNPKVKVRFSRTVIPDNDLADQGLAFLEERLGWDLHRAALLVERDTAYGSYFSGLSPEAGQNPRLSKITKLLFPSGLYALRNAWEASGAPPAQTVAGNPKAFTPKTALEVSLADQRTPVDVVPELSPLSARIYDMALADLLRQVASEGYSYVGILATDVKDQLFLAEQVRRWAPGAVLFLIDNNLLYVHPQYTATTFGMLTISSFPLTVEGGQRLVSPAWLETRSRRQFASERQEGTLLAVRRLVSGSPSPNPAGRGVWIAACGNYAMWPLARLDLVPKSAPTYPAWMGNLGPSWESRPSPGTRGPPDRLDWNLACLAFLACLLSYLLNREASSWAQIQRLTRRLLSGAAALLSLAGAFLVGLWITRLQASYAARGHVTVAYWVCEAWRSWLLLGLLVSGYLYLAHLLAGTMGASGRRRWILAAVSMAALLVPPLAAFAAWRDSEGLFYMRARAFTGGVSPLVSLGWFAAACFFWLVVELRRQWVRRRHQVPWPLEHFRDPFLVGCNVQAVTIDRLLRASIPPSKLCWLATVAVVAPPAVFLWTRMQPIAESRCYGLVFLLLTMGLSILSAMTFFRFLAVWLHISHLLRRVQKADLLPALQEVSAEMDWKPTQFRRYQESFTAVIRSVERLQRLIDRRLVVKRPGQGDLSALLERLVTAASLEWFDDELACRDEINDRCDQACRRLSSQRAIQGVEPFYAVLLIAYVRHVFNQLRYSIMGAMGCDLALIVGVSTFAFQPKNFLILALWSTMVAASAATLVVFVQMERDATLSAIGGSDAGKVTYDWAFVSKLLVYTVVPIVGLVASQFPAMGRLFSSLLDPLARVLGSGS